MGYKISVTSLFTTLVFSLGLICWYGTANAESAEELKAQLKTMQEQMQTMQQTMQKQMQAMQAMQDRIKELEAVPETEEPEVAAPAEEHHSVWSKYNMQLYGKIKTDFNYDTAQFYNNDYLATVRAGDHHTNDSTNFNPRDTRFGFKVGHGFGDWVAKGRFEIDFYGDTSGDNLIPRMRLAYTDVSNTSTGTSLRVGQDWIPISTLSPNTVDFGILSASGNLWWRIPQITLRQKFGDIELMGSVMKHRRTDTENEDRMPWLLTRVALNGGLIGDGNMLALGGGYRNADYGQNTSTHDDRWLVAGEAKFLFGPLLMQGEFWTGKGIGRNFLRYDLDIGDDGNPAFACGGWFDVTYYMDAMSFTAGYGIDNPDDGDIKTFDYDGANPDRRFTKNQQIYLNTWYTLTKPLQVGFEWIYIQTERGSRTNTGNRYTASMKYCF